MLRARGRGRCQLESSPEEATGKGQFGDYPDSDPEDPQLLETQTPGQRLGAVTPQAGPTGLPQTQGHIAPSILGSRITQHEGPGSGFCSLLLQGP